MSPPTSPHYRRTSPSARFNSNSPVSSLRFSTSSNNLGSSSIVDPRSLGYFQNRPVVRKNASVPNLSIAAKQQGQDPDFNFSSDGTASISKRLLNTHTTTAASVSKTLRYHKKSFSIHDSWSEKSDLSPSVSPVASKTELKARPSLSKLNFSFRSPPFSSLTGSGAAADNAKPPHHDSVEHTQEGSLSKPQSGTDAVAQPALDPPHVISHLSNAEPLLPPQANHPNIDPDAAQLTTDSPFLRALHSFDASSLSSENNEIEESASAICLSFQESEIVLLHTIHASGWGDATILSTGVRGWIPTNYFATYTDSKMASLLSAVLSFSLNPKSEQLPDSEEHTFAQSSISNIVAGVRSLLEASATLTRDTPIVRRSQNIRKFRKILLAELAILVSLSKQYSNTTEDANIERLVTGSYKIISRAVIFLDIWTIDTGYQEWSSFRNGSLADTLSSAIRRDNAPTVETIHEQPSASGDDSQRSGSRAGRNPNRDSIVFHKEPPFAKQRLDEVNDALTSYLGNFIHRMTVIETDPTACTQILVNTRKSMLACRELLATVESISSRSLPRNKDLENCKDKLFSQIRNLVTAARDVVASTPIKTEEGPEEATTTPEGTPSEQTKKLIDIATDCAKISGECVVRCRHILDKIGDFQLSNAREYPDFSGGIISVSLVSPSDSTFGDDKNQLPVIPSLSPILGDDTYLKNNLENFDDRRVHKSTSISALAEEDGSKDIDIPLEEQVIIDDIGRVRGGSLEGLVKVLTEEEVDQDPTFVSSFFLTFRQFTTPTELANALIKRYNVEVDETYMDSEDIEALVSRRSKVFNVFKRWMESHWKHSVDVVVLPQIVSFSNSIVGIPNAKVVIKDLAEKVQSGEVIVKRSITIPESNKLRMAAVAYSHTPMIGSTVSKHLQGLLAKAVEHMEADEDDAKSLQSGSASTWSTSLRMVKNNVGLGTVTFLDIEAADIARQLTVMDSQLFSKIKAEELLDLNFSLKKRHLGIAVNVNEITQRANQLSSFVGDSILSGDVQVKARKNMIKQWIKVAEKCYELRNFNSLMTIISALQSVNIARLKKTWEILSPRYLQTFLELKTLMSMDKNYGNYRAVLRKNEIPTLPYLGLYLTDLTFVMEGNSTHRLMIVEDGKVITPGKKPRGSATTSKMVINFDRHERTARIIGEVESFQVPVRIGPVPELQRWLLSEMNRSFLFVSKDHNTLWRRSCQLEPK